jgi:endoglucanase
MLVRATAVDTKFDIRFVDTKTSEPNDHPWRMRKTISSSECNWDKRWHHLHLPLSEFIEQGSWDDGQWFNPEGQFDWTAIDKFEIVAEWGSLIDKEIWFDNVYISNQDTANILESGTLSKENLSTLKNTIDLYCWPNPMENSTSFNCEIASNGFIVLSIYNSQGRLIKELVNQYMPKGNFKLTWNGLDTAGNVIPTGIYICQLTSSNSTKFCKLLKV